MAHTPNPVADTVEAGMRWSSRAHTKPVAAAVSVWGSSVVPSWKGPAFDSGPQVLHPCRHSRPYHRS